MLNVILGLLRSDNVTSDHIAAYCLLDVSNFVSEGSRVLYSQISEM